MGKLRCTCCMHLLHVPVVPVTPIAPVALVAHVACNTLLSQTGHILFSPTGGYTFISHNELSVLTNNALQKMITSRTDVLLKLRRLDSSQEYTVIKALDG